MVTLTLPASPGPSLSRFRGRGDIMHPLPDQGEGGTRISGRVRVAARDKDKGKLWI